MAWRGVYIAAILRNSLYVVRRHHRASTTALVVQPVLKGKSMVSEKDDDVIWRPT